MRISDWSSDVCSSDLNSTAGSATPTRRSKPNKHYSFQPQKRKQGGTFTHSNALSMRLKCAARKSRARARNRSEEHTSELQSLMRISYAVFCLKKKKKHEQNTNIHNK